MTQHFTTIDLTGPDGNAVRLLAHARRIALEGGLPAESIMTEMTSGDYNHLLKTFKRWFGNSIKLIH